jgi:hypothetical protein
MPPTTTDGTSFGARRFASASFALAIMPKAKATTKALTPMRIFSPSNDLPFSSERLDRD